MFGRISNNIPENDVGVCRNINQYCLFFKYIYDSNFLSIIVGVSLVAPNAIIKNS